MSESDDEYGPALPPGMQPSKNDESDSQSDDQYGPALPGKQRDSNTNIHHTEKQSIGPQLPETSSHRTETDTNVIGPVLPPNFSKRSKYSSDSDSDSSDSSGSESSGRRKKKHRKSSNKRDSDCERNKVDKTYIGPSLPPNLRESSSLCETGKQNAESDSDDDIVGPSLDLQASEKDLSAVKEFEARSQKMKDKLNSKIDDTEAPTKRESWMTDLPDAIGVNFGLSNRQFRKSDAPEMDSGWAEGPSDKNKKDEKKRKKDKDEYFQSEQDRKAAKEIEKYNKKHRPESLLEMHKKELKKKKKKEKKKNKDKPKERRPFDRDVDLKVNKFDDALRQAYIKRSQELGSRFKNGGSGTSFL